MQNNEIEELQEYYSSQLKEDICEKLVEIISISKIHNMERDALVENILNNSNSLTIPFDFENMEIYIKDEICDEGDDEDSCTDKYYDYQANELIDRLNTKSMPELKEILTFALYDELLFQNIKDNLLNDLIQTINDQKVNNQQLKLLGGINKIKLSIPENIEILKEDEGLLVAKHNNSIIKFESENNNDYRYIFNSVLNEMFVSAIATNYYKGFVKIKIGNVGGDCPINFENKFCSIIEEDFIKGDTMGEWIHKSLGSKNFGERLPRIFLQTFENLYKIHKDTGYTHYDLHTGNVIIDKNDIPYIIDYGFSHVTHKGKNYGCYNLSGEIYNRPMWLHDIFKLLMTSFFKINTVILLDNIHITLYAISFCTINYSKIIKVIDLPNRVKLENMYQYSKNFLDEFKLMPQKNYELAGLIKHVYSDFIENFELIHTFLIMNKALNMFLNQYNLFLISKSFEGMPIEYITAEDYRENYNPFFAPTKFMQNNNKITFEKFLGKFSDSLQIYDLKPK